jgi:16S rRNA (guanine527-N7)-methyltransferase
MPWEPFLQAAAGLGYRLTDLELHAFRRLAELVEEGNRRAALTAIGGLEDLVSLHLLDALAGARALEGHPPPARIIDVGSGAGFPALPLAIALPRHRLWLDAEAGPAPPPEVVAVESVGKKCAFMREAAGALGLVGRFRAEARRAEEAGRDPALRERFPLATARALAPLRVLVELTLPFVEPGGALVAWKGPKAAEEVAAAEHAIRELGGGEPELIPSTVPGRDLVFVRVPKLRPTPERYPRRVGVPKKRPL